MTISLPLQKMSVSDKLRALEDIWEDLSRNPKSVPMPAWHADVLKAREKRVRSGAARFTDWTEAKRTIRERVR